MIAHVALFRTRQGLTKDELRSFAQLFQTACRDIPSIRSAKAGPITNVTTKPTYVGDKPYNVAVFLEFDDRFGLDAYMKHPIHADLARLFWEYCETTVFADIDMVDPVVADIEVVFGLKT